MLVEFRILRPLASDMYALGTLHFTSLLCGNNWVDAPGSLCLNNHSIIDDEREKTGTK